MTAQRPTRSTIGPILSTPTLPGQDLLSQNADETTASSANVTRGSRKALVAFRAWPLALALGLVSASASAAEGDTATQADPVALQKAYVTLVQGISDKVDAAQGDLKKLKGLKISGFIQARLDLNESSKDGIGSDGRTASNKDQFYIRRGRIKTTYTGIPGAEVVLQIDATGRGFSLIDAEASLLSPWKEVEGKLTLGQTKVPFGHEIAQSSNERELPERTLVVNRFFPGVRDIGLKVSGGFNVARFSLAAFNGNGISDTATVFKYQLDKNADGVITEDEEAVLTGSALNFANTDRDKAKDFAARVGVDLKFLVANANAYVGSWGKLPTLIGVKDANTGVTTYSGGNELTYIPKTRFGGDLQLNLDLVKPLGKSIVRAEYILGHGLFYNDKELDQDAAGWYVTLVQNLTDKAAFVARVDAFDPNTAADALEDDTLNIEPGLLLFPTQNTRVTVSYQVVQDHDDKDDAGNKVDKKNNQLSVQLQGRF